MIPGIAIPALVALIPKLVLLGYSLRSQTKNSTTRLFLLLLLCLALYNLDEFILLNHIATRGIDYRAWQYGYVYFALFIPAVALILHVSLRLSLDFPINDPRVRLQALLYLPAAVLIYLVLFTDKLVLGFQPFMNTALRVPGTWYFLFEAYLVVYFFISLVMLCYGARASRPSAIRRLRNRWWLVAIAPTLLLAFYLIIANHFGIARVTSTIYVPIALTFFLIVTTYATHQHRLFDIEFYIPWSKARKRKTALYERIENAISKVGEFPAIDETAAVLLSQTLRCPATIVLDGEPPTVWHARGETQIQCTFR